MANFYAGLSPSAYWRKAVSERTIFNLQGLYSRKFEITRGDAIAAAGSCFAQHVSAQLRRRGFNVLDVEPPPEFLSEAESREMGYGIYSARYGNIYTVRQFLQLIGDSHSGAVRTEDFLNKGGRWFDLLRPTVEPLGFESLEEAMFARRDHLRSVRDLFSKARLVVFTLGLTEAWLHKESGTVYPILPDTLNDVDSARYRFHNFDYAETAADFRALYGLLQAQSPGVRMLLTVSPVPLTATASGRHVMVATAYSKSVLRAVCGEMESEFADIDYFPSYEVITAPLGRGIFYEANMRSVSQMGVDVAMATFFAEHDCQPVVIPPDSIPGRLRPPWAVPRTTSCARRSCSTRFPLESVPTRREAP